MQIKITSAINLFSQQKFLTAQTNTNNNNNDLHRMNSADSEEAKRNPPFEGNSFLQQQSVCWWESKEDDRADLSGTNTPIGLKWLRANKDALDAREKRTTEAIEKARVEAEQIRKEKYIKIRRQGIKLREKMQKMNIRQNAEHVGAPNVKFVGTQTRDTQRSTVQSQLKKEELRPSLNDVDPNRTSRISSHVAESECRLTRRGVESLKKACLVLERELAGICRSPDPGSEQGEESQVSQVRAEIFHLQKKLLDLSNAQKQRAAVLDRAVRLVDQMSRIGSQSNMSHKSHCSSWTSEREDNSNSSKCSSPKQKILSPNQIRSQSTHSRSDFDGESAFLKDHHKRLQMDEPELLNQQRGVGLPKGPFLKRSMQKRQMDGRLASFRCLDIPKIRSSFPPGKSTVRSANCQIHNQAVKTHMDRNIVQRSLPPTQLKQGDKMPTAFCGYGQRRSSVSHSTNASDEMRNEGQAIPVTNESANPFELMKQRIESLQYRRQCLRNILQEVTDRKHHLFKRDDVHAEKPALEKKQKELTETLEKVQREMEQLQQSIHRRRFSAL
uniref:Uncharacterized protein n=1 Tax=Schistocephalus solidus TaxID=70667 RepID=A0A0X3NX50_SCHSO